MRKNTDVSEFEVTDSRVYCRRRLGMRIAVGIFGVVLGAMCLGLLAFAWPSPASLAQRAPVDILSNVVPLLIVPVVGLLGPTLLFFYVAGPADLIVDIPQRTYRLRRSFPLLASWRSGPLEDIAGLRVNTVKNKSGTSYRLLLDWRNTQAAVWTLGDGPVAGRRPFPLTFSQDAGLLREEAQRLSQRLGVPVQDATPFWEQKRSRTWTGMALVFIVFFCLLVFPQSWLVKRTLQAQGQETTAVVTAMRYRKSCQMRYEYRVGGREFDGRSTVSWSTYSSLDIGSRVPVRYLPAYPHTSVLVGAL